MRKATHALVGRPKHNQVQTTLSGLSGFEKIAMKLGGKSGGGVWEES